MNDKINKNKLKETGSICCDLSRYLTRLVDNNKEEVNVKKAIMWSKKKKNTGHENYFL